MLDFNTKELGFKELKELSLCHKLTDFNHNIFATQLVYTFYISNLDILIKKSEFVSKTQFDQSLSYNKDSSMV